VQRLYEPNATRPPWFLNLPRQIGQLRTALTVPAGLGAKGRALAAAIRYTDWRRKLVGPHPTPASDHGAGD
jgi:hypothetical protein